MAKAPRFGPRPKAEDRKAEIRKSLEGGLGIRATARKHNASLRNVATIARTVAAGR